MPGELIIRKYRLGDRAAVRRLCCDTAFMGEPCSAFIDADELFADALTAYFTDHEPQSCFIAEQEGEVAGYLIGTLDVKRMDELCARKILPGLLAKAVFSGALFKGKNINFLRLLLRSALKGELRQPDFRGDYPATLHINLRAQSRGLHAGSRLVAEYLAYLKQEGVKGVHIATMSENGARFFEKQGFALLFRAPRSYFRHLLGRDFLVYVYGKIVV